MKPLLIVSLVAVCFWGAAEIPGERTLDRNKQPCTQLRLNTL